MARARLAALCNMMRLREFSWFQNPQATRSRLAALCNMMRLREFSWFQNPQATRSTALMPRL